MKILITGSGGMLGNELCDVLSKAGHTVIGVDIKELHVQCPVSCGFHVADINDPHVLTAVFEKENPEIVVHTAAWTDVDGCEIDPKKAHKINVEGTRNVAQASVTIGAKLVFISTDFVFGGQKNTSYTESDECAPLSVYAKTKWEAEEEVRRIVEDHIIVRTSWLFGKGGKNFVDTIIFKSEERKTLQVVNDQTGSPTYTKDLARGIKKLIDNGIKDGEIYNLCNSGQCSWYDFAVKIKSFEENMKDVVIEPVSSLTIARPAARPAFSVLDTSKFQSRTGMSLRKWEDALAEYIADCHHPEGAEIN